MACSKKGMLWRSVPWERCSHAKGVGAKCLERCCGCLFEGNIEMLEEACDSPSFRRSVEAIPPSSPSTCFAAINADLLAGQNPGVGAILRLNSEYILRSDTRNRARNQKARLKALTDLAEPEAAPRVPRASDP